MHRYVVLAAAAFALSGCAYSVPIVAISDKGQVLRGTATSDTSKGSNFFLADGRTKCGGVFDTWSTQATINVQVACSDGRKGIVIATRDSSGVSGQGTFTLDDGTLGKFIFGAGAANF